MSIIRAPSFLRHLDFVVRHSRVWTLLALLAITLGAVGLRLYRLDETWLWFDEIFGATFASLNLFDATIAAARFDIHPPVWSYQLQAWALLGLSDRWLLANSVLWSVAGVLSLYWTVDRVYGRRVAIIAAVLLAVLPVSVAYARFLRMYAMLMAVTVWAWYCNDRALRRDDNRRWLVGAGVCELVIAYSHGIGVLVNGYLVLYGLLLAASERPNRRRLRNWSWAQVLIGGLSVGGLVNGVIRQVTHTSAPNLSELRATLADFWFAPSWGGVLSAEWAALGLCLLIGLSAVCFRRGRETTVALCLGPILGTVIVSYVVRPIWHLHALLFSVPFAALALALAVDHLASRVKSQQSGVSGQERGVRSLIPNFALSAALTSVVAVPFAAFSAYHVTRFQKETDYPGIVAKVEAAVRPSDIVFVPQHPDYWAVARYALGPGWGSPLKIQPLEPTEDRWGQVLTSLGPTWRRRLHLEPESRFIEHDGVKFVIGESSEPFVLGEHPPHIFLIRSRTTEGYEFPGYKVVSREQHHGVQLLVFERRPDRIDAPRSSVPTAGQRLGSVAE